MCNNGYFWMSQITFADVIKIFRFYLKKCKQKNAPKKKLSYIIFLLEKQLLANV